MTALIEAINNGDSLPAIQGLVVSQPSLVNTTDLQGNTPLHYAAARCDQPLIHFLIGHKSDPTAKNCEGETAADWWRSYVTVMYQWDGHGDLERLPEEIEKGNENFLEYYLQGQEIQLIRYPKGETLLHIAAHHRQLPIVKLLLNGTNNKILDKLLHSKNSRGETPLAVAQAASLQGKEGAQAIVSYLQEKEQAVAEPLDVQAKTSPTGEPFLISLKCIQSLSELLSQSVTQANFESLRPLLPTLCSLAWVACEQAKYRLSSTPPLEPKLCWKKSSLRRTQRFLQQLFGKPYDAALSSQLQQKIAAVADYLSNLILRKQVFQSIELSNEHPDFEGWSILPSESIFLNPTRKTNLIGLVKTLIHEVTHIVNGSIDFTYNPVQVKSQGRYALGLSAADRLASRGEITALPFEKQILLKTWHLLEQGDSGDELKHWLAANNADTQAVVILGLAAQNSRHADFDHIKKKLQIDGQFLSCEYMEKTYQQRVDMGGLTLYLCTLYRTLSGKFRKSLSGSSIRKALKEKLPLATDAVNTTTPSGSSSLLAAPEETPANHSGSTEEEWSDLSATDSDSSNRSLPVDETQQLRQQMAASSISIDGASAAVGSAQPGPSHAGNAGLFRLNP